MFGNPDATSVRRPATGLALEQAGPEEDAELGTERVARRPRVRVAQRLSPFHISTLVSVRYALNSRGSGFDTEIIVQLLASGARITEREIPRYYGDEICHLSGLRHTTRVKRPAPGTCCTVVV